MFENQKILVTGGTGTFGKEFIKHAIKTNAKKIYILSRDELKQSQLKAKYQDNEKLSFLIGNVRDLQRLKIAFREIDIVIHAAALKQVPSCEYNPIEAVKTNIYGSQNVIDAAIYNNVSKVMFISTDKAVQPINLYGTTKSVMEKLATSAIAYIGNKNIKISVVRYGNVIGSRGSVINVFKKAKLENKSFPITHQSMTRFWILPKQAINFVIDCINLMSGGEIFVPKIPSMRVIDLCNSINKNANCNVIGIRQGEKLHETLISKEENDRVLDCGKYFIIKPGIDFYNYKIDESIQSKKIEDEKFYYASNNNEEWLSIETMKKYIDLIGE